MTETQKKKLQLVYDALSNDEKSLDLINLPIVRFKNLLHDDEEIKIEISDKIDNLSIFTGYSGTISILRSTKNEVILKPILIKMLLS
jgi:hypothetical protein